MASWTRCRSGAFAASMMLVSPALTAQGTSVPQARSATPATLVGVVTDSAGHPIPGVEVWLKGLDLFTHTNDAGGFRVPGIPAGPVKVSLRRLGFEPATVDLKVQPGRIDSLVVSLTEVASTLPGVLVEDEADVRSHRILAGFWDRRAHGQGHFFTRSEIEAMNAHDFTDIVRLTPGVTVLTKGGRKVFRFSRHPMMRGDCPPQFVVDGMRIDNGNPDDFPPIDVEAIELYASTATLPPQFAPKPNANVCGAVVVWTRIPGL